MVKADDDPSRNFGDYLDIIEKRMQGSEDDVALVLSMVTIIIDAYKWNETKTELGTFTLQVFYEIEKHNHIRYAYYEQAKNHYENRKERVSLSPDSEFTRRPINYRLMADNYSVEDLSNLFGADVEKANDFICALGKDEEEQYIIASFLEDQMYSFFPDGWRRKAFFDSIKSEIHKRFHGDEENAEMEAQIEEDLMKEYMQQWELDYYKDEYQKQKTEIATLHAEIEKIQEAVRDVVDRHTITQEQFDEIFSDENIASKDENDCLEKTEEYVQVPETKALQKEKGKMESQLTHQVNELQQQLAEKTKALQEALQIIEEYSQPVKELTAKQKIRMEVAVQLLLNSGLTEQKLDSGYKSKVASILSLLLGIGHQNCYNYLVNRKYCPQKQDKETILELDRLCAELGINAFLSTKSQGNKKD